MRKYLWLVMLAIPPWVAVELDASKWIVMLAVVPFFLFAMTLDDPDEHLLGEASSGFRKATLLFIGAGGIVLTGVIYILWQVFFPDT
jgi:hypothetical protein